MRVLVTRPEPACGRTAARLRDLGHKPVELPLFTTRLHPGRAGNPAAAAASASMALALVTIRAAAAPSPQVLSVPVLAVGAATAAAATALGFADVTTGPGSGRALARTVLERIGTAALSPSPQRPLIYLAGTPRHPELEAMLAEAGVAVDVRVVYEMVEISYSTDFLFERILVPPPDAILLYSANAARRTVALLAAETLAGALVETRFLCLSDEVRGKLPPAWAIRAVTAAAPDEASLLASLAALQ